MGLTFLISLGFRLLDEQGRDLYLEVIIEEYITKFKYILKREEFWNQIILEKKSNNIIKKYYYKPHLPQITNKGSD